MIGSGGDGAELRQLRRIAERHQRREIEAAHARFRDQAFQALAPLGECEGAQILAAEHQAIIGAHERRMAGQHLLRNDLAD